MIMNVRTKYMVDCMASAFDEQTHSVQVSTDSTQLALNAPPGNHHHSLVSSSKELDVWSVSNFRGVIKSLTAKNSY